MRKLAVLAATLAACLGATMASAQTGATAAIMTEPLAPKMGPRHIRSGECPEPCGLAPSAAYECVTERLRERPQRIRNFRRTLFLVNRSADPERSEQLLDMIESCGEYRYGLKELASAVDEFPVPPPPTPQP